MNLSKPEDVIFTDSLTKAFRSYQTIKDFPFCARTETDYLKTRLDRFQARVNQ